MRSFKILILIGVVFFFSTGASIIDNETKTNVSELTRKLDRLVQLEQSWNMENERLLREQKEAIQRLNVRMDALSGHLDSIKTRVDEIENTAPLVLQPASIAAVPSAPTPPSIDPTPEPVMPPPVVSKILPLLPYIVSAVSVILLFALFVRIRRGEAEIRRRLWKNEMDTLRDELAYESPSMPPANPKIRVTGEFSRRRLP